MSTKSIFSYASISISSNFVGKQTFEYITFLTTRTFSLFSLVCKSTSIKRGMSFSLFLSYLNPYIFQLFRPFCHGFTNNSLYLPASKTKPSNSTFFNCSGSGMLKAIFVLSSKAKSKYGKGVTVPHSIYLNVNIPLSSKGSIQKR